MFWKDTWDLGVLQWKYPQLFSFVTDQYISVSKFLSQDAYENFHAPLSIIASTQLQELAVLVHSLTQQRPPHDTWTYIWGMEVFSSKKAYTAPLQMDVEIVC